MFNFKKKPTEKQTIGVTSTLVGSLIDLTATFPPHKRQCGVVKKLHDPKKHGPVGSPLYAEKSRQSALVNTPSPVEGADNYDKQLAARNAEIEIIAGGFEVSSGVPAKEWVPLIEKALNDNATA